MGSKIISLLLLIFSMMMVMWGNNLSISTSDTNNEKTSNVPSKHVLEMPTRSALQTTNNNDDEKKIRQQMHQKLHSYRGNHYKTLIGLHEQMLVFLLSSILHEEDGMLLPEGSFLDCGAQFGEQGAHYAVTSPNRKVIAMDPSSVLVEHMRKEWGSLPNLEIRQGGLGRKVGTMRPRDGSFNMAMDMTFPVYTLDSMYFDKGEKLALAHIDVEGLELDVLNGGLKTIRANRPIFTVELRVHESNKTTPLLNLIDSEGYDTYVIDEPCGMPPVDLRNILCIPREKGVAFGMSDGFNLLYSMGGLMRVTSKDIAQKILPCCALGKECCPGDNLYDESQCCTEKQVLQWYAEHKDSKPIQTIAFKEGRKEFSKMQYRLRQRAKVKGASLP